MNGCHLVVEIGVVEHIDVVIRTARGDSYDNMSVVSGDVLVKRRIFGKRLRVYVGAENILGPGVGMCGETAVDDGGQQGDVRLFFVETLVDDDPGRKFAVLHLAAPGVAAQVVVGLEYLEAAFGNEIAVIVGHPVLRPRGEVAAGNIVEFPVAEVESAGRRIAFARIGVDDGTLSGGGVEVPGELLILLII